MAWSFGDGFDCYATMADPIAGYWDGGLGVGGANSLAAGRFAGSQALAMSSVAVFLIKSSIVNDQVHHITVAFRQTSVLSGTVLVVYFQLSDGATNQCCIVFRSDGAILLTSATAAGTVLATYTGAVTAQNTWFAFEFEVIISNTVGRFRARKNGNTLDDFDSGATLNTRPGANSYANKLTIGMQAGGNIQQIDDLLWRSDAASVPFVGDIRCYTRMPASDASVQFSRSPASNVQTPFTLFTTTSVNAGSSRYTPFTAAYDGTVSTATVSLNVGYTGNLKTALFASSGGVPTTVLGSANIITNPVSGNNIITFGTPVPVIKGTQYWIGWDSDTTSGQFNTASGSAGFSASVVYASFPAATPTGTTTTPTICTITIGLSTNATVVNEPQQDGTTSYVYDSTAGHADFYNIAALSPTPASVVAVTTRGFLQKSDTGARSAAVQLRSGGTTVASTTTALSTSFGWLWRTDTVNPATSTTWTNTAVDAVQVGPTVIS